MCKNEVANLLECGSICHPFFFFRGQYSNGFFSSKQNILRKKISSKKEECLLLKIISKLYINI
jgi:hypothetical protein